MVIGNGLVGKAFKPIFGKNEEVVVFASGVSDSNEKGEYEFSREWELLRDCVNNKCKGKKLVYFSTISLYDPSLNHKPYQSHKYAIEEYLQEKYKNSLIVRSPNVIGAGGNSANLLNYLFDKIKSGAHFEAWENAERNIMDVQDFAQVVSAIVKDQSHRDKIVDVVYPYSYRVLEIVEHLESCLLKKANLTVVEKGSLYVPDIDSYVRDIMSNQGIYIGQDYLARVIRKNFKWGV